MAKKGVPKQDGSGHGQRDNLRRGGCTVPRKIGQGQTPQRRRLPKPPGR